MDLIIKANLIIPSNELQWRFSRSSGPGGQNVNKADSRVEIVFNIDTSRVLSTSQKFRIKTNLTNRINGNKIRVPVQEKRTQLQNRKLALTRLAALIKQGLKPISTTRKTTQPTRSSKQRRVDLKKKRGQLKKSRQQNSYEKDF